MPEQNDNDYQYFPSRTIGGPTGDYELISPIPSGKWAEFLIVDVTFGTGTTSSVLVSGNAKFPQLAYDGSKAIGLADGKGGSAITAIPFRDNNIGLSIIGPMPWERITNSEQKVFVRIDTADGASVYVTIKFRERILKIIPGPPVQVHPDHAHQLNIAREEKTHERLNKMGIPEKYYKN